jgi:hypothetical protein
MTWLHVAFPPNLIRDTRQPTPQSRDPIRKMQETPPEVDDVARFCGVFAAFHALVRAVTIAGSQILQCYGPRDHFA